MLLLGLARVVGLLVLTSSPVPPPNTTPDRMPSEKRTTKETATSHFVKQIHSSGTLLKNMALDFVDVAQYKTLLTVEKKKYHTNADSILYDVSLCLRKQIPGYSWAMIFHQTAAVCC